MGKVHDALSDQLIAWIERQPMFFVGTAPIGLDGHVSVSPKGTSGTLSVIDPTTVSYLDLTGSGAETVAHLRENGRITLMWCAFEGPARIVRVQGQGEVITPDDDAWADMAQRFPEMQGARAIIIVRADRISDSCGYSVPLMDYREDRTRLTEWADQRSKEELIAYRAEKNAVSVDGLPSIGSAVTG